MNNSLYKFNLTAKQQFLVLIPFFLINIAISIGAFYFFESPNTTAILIGAAVVFVLNVLPVLILHIQYLFKGHNSVAIDTQNRTIELQGSGSNKKYSLDDIASFDYYATHGHCSKRGSSLWYTFDPYRFYKITFKDNHVAYITCLSINDIENTLEPLLGLQAEWRFRAIPLLY
ncbi:hypothetical protein OCK74_25925 [Chitinophagaceae bacterium LB-8]|uniref:PH domain-containing protein n=1 Tax=Paraflavisolibacter caeni TaxID=2982496 RepID=A0A9X2XQ42_9BACT|nr:hypothetical protein [Paraflavisolibacter caeni]MCU7552584.1 hypothetical protein [Paraflavisolibacter caeni]